MIVGFLLVLALISPDGRIRGETIQMPSYKLCERAMKAFLTPPPVEDEDEARPANRRTAACLSVPAAGQDT